MGKEHSLCELSGPAPVHQQLLRLIHTGLAETARVSRPGGKLKRIPRSNGVSPTHTFTFLCKRPDTPGVCASLARLRLFLPPVSYHCTEKEGRTRVSLRCPARSQHSPPHAGIPPLRVPSHPRRLTDRLRDHFSARSLISLTQNSANFRTAAQNRSACCCCCCWLCRMPVVSRSVTWADF